MTKQAGQYHLYVYTIRIMLAVVNTCSDRNAYYFSQAGEVCSYILFFAQLCRILFFKHCMN